VIAEPSHWGEDGWPRWLASACHGQRDRRTGEVSLLVPPGIVGKYVPLHGRSVEQSHQGEKPVYRPMLEACDHEPAFLRLEPSERVDEDVYPGRVHERDFGQVHDERTGSTLEDRQQDLQQDRRRNKVEFPSDAEHRWLLTVFIGREEAC
jgi:hypothetical protein